MISETTNFSRDSIGTPTLNAYEDIRLNEVSLKELILDESETETADVVSILGIENFINRGSETIHAFRFGCKDYFGRYFNYVTVRRQNGDNSIDSFESTNDVWMAAICYDKNNNIIETFFSIDKNKQERNVYETTWNFDPFIIKSSYAFIEFRITMTEGEVNINPSHRSMKIRTSNIKYNPSDTSLKFYIEGWYTVDQVNNICDFTTDFVVGMTKRYSSLTKHIRDIDIHLNSDLREKIENLTDVPILERDLNDHINDKSIHLNSALKNKIENSADNSVVIKIENDLNEHINTENLHLNEERLEIIESIPDIVSEIVDDSLRKTIITDNLASDGRGLIYGADLDLKRISSGTIKSISIKNPGGSSESAQGNHYLALQFFKEGDPDTTNEYKSLEETYFSKEPVNLTTSSDYNFDFEGVNVPHDINFVRLMLTTSNTEVPNPRDTNTVSLMRVGLTNYNKESEEDCYVFSKGAGYSIRNKGILSNCYIIYDNIETLTASEKIFYTHINDFNIHLTENDRKEAQEHYSDTFIHLNENDRKDAQEHYSNTNIHISPDINEKLENFNFDNISKVSSLTNEFLESTTLLKKSTLNPKDYVKDEIVFSQSPEMIFAFSCSCEDIKNKKITSITLHKKEDSTGLDTDTSATSSQKEVWLFATCYDSAGQIIEGHTYFSSNKTKQYANERDVIWYFDNFNILDEFNTIEFRITNTEGVAERNNIANHSNTNRIRSSSFASSGEKLYIPGWTTLNQANVKENITTNFTIGLEENLNYVETINDDLITHKNDSLSHFANEEKSFLIKDGFTYTAFEEGDVDDNYSSCHGFQLGPKHIKPGLLKEIRIPHKPNSNTDITDENGHYMAVQIFRHGDQDTSTDNKSLFETYFSENTHVVVPGVAGEYRYTFENLYIPTSFKYIRFIPVKSKDVAPNGFDINNCSVMTLRPIRRNGATNFDDDGCYVLVGNNNKVSLLTKCTLIYSKEKTNIPFFNVISRGWRFEISETNTLTEDSMIGLYNKLSQEDNAIVSTYVNEMKYYNSSSSLFENTKKTYVLTIIYPRPKTGEDVIDSFDQFNLRSGYGTDYPILYPVYF